MNELKYQGITEKIIGCAFEVHTVLGNGFQEVIYQRALALEFQSEGVLFDRETEIDIFYKDHEKPIGARRADFLVEKKVLVELKALPDLEGVHFAQIRSYLKAYRLEVGLLINFGRKSMQFKRVVLTDHE
ncbi:MAG TPA: GxxExxY protein [Chryseosolibacter sp.]|nr:GxxExxY protein [Chryseosolibacter sp.]